MHPPWTLTVRFSVGGHASAQSPGGVASGRYGDSVLVGQGHYLGDLLHGLGPDDDVGEVLEGESGLLREGGHVVAVQDLVHAADGHVTGSDDLLQLLEDGGGDLPGELDVLDGPSHVGVLDPPDEPVGGLVAVLAGAPDAGPSAELLGLVRGGVVVGLGHVAGQFDRDGALVGDVSGDVEPGDSLEGVDGGGHVPQGDVHGCGVGVDAGADSDVAELVVHDGLVGLRRAGVAHHGVEGLEVRVDELLCALEGDDSEVAVEGDLQGLDRGALPDGLEDLLHLVGGGELVPDGLGHAEGVDLECDVGDDGEPSGGRGEGLDHVVSGHVVADLVVSGLQELPGGVDGADVDDGVLDGSVLVGSDSVGLGVDPVLDGGVLSGGADSDGVSLGLDGLDDGAELASGLGPDGLGDRVDVDEGVHVGHVDEDVALGVAPLPAEGGDGASCGHDGCDGLGQLVGVGGLDDGLSLAIGDLRVADQGAHVLECVGGHFGAFCVAFHDLDLPFCVAFHDLDLHCSAQWLYLEKGYKLMRYKGFQLGKEMRENEISPASRISLAMESRSAPNRCVRHLQSEHPKPSAKGVIPHPSAMDASVHSGT